MTAKPDYQVLLTDIVTAGEVAALAGRVERLYADTCLSIVPHVINGAGGDCTGAITSLDQDGLQRANFELRLLEAGAKMTYERVRLQGFAVQTVFGDIQPNPSLEELNELIECVNVFETSGAIKRMIDDVREKTGIQGARLGDLGDTGFGLVYNELIRVIVNPGEKL